MDQDVLRQVDANEHHLADALFTFSPIWTEVTAHQLVHTLEDHLFVGALHVQHAFVAQHLGTINIDDGTQEIFQLGWIKLALGLVHKALHIIVVVMMVAVVAVLVVHMVMVAVGVIMAMIVVMLV